MRHITYGKGEDAIEMTVRAATAGDDLKGQIAYIRLSPLQPTVRYGLWKQFGTLCSAVVNQRGLPFDPHTILDASNEQLLDAFAWFEKMPKRLYDAWLSATGEDELPLKNEPTNDPNLPAVEKP